LERCERAVKFEQMTGESRLIEGIYNYCDRWCERCAFTSRCMLYSREQEDLDDPADRDIHSDAFWSKLASIFKQTQEMITELAAEQGIDLEAIDTQSLMEAEERLRDKSESHPLSRSAEHYIKLVNEWFDQYSASEQERESGGIRSDLPLVDFDAADRASNIQEVIDVIRWYQFQIAVKIMRGLMGDDPGRAEELDAVSQRDSDGSVKVALIGMERSLSAWGKLRELLPGKNDSIVAIMLHLEQLRRSTEQTFPNAMSFVRAGFDEAPDQFVS